jgi:DNA primase
MKCPENTIPILGSSLSKTSRLHQKIVAKQSSVIVSLDPDLKEKTYDLAESLFSDGCNVSVTFAPHGRDLGDLSLKDAKRIIDNSVKYTSYMRLSHKIGSMRSGSLV